jgi:hypothetical protein
MLNVIAAIVYEIILRFRLPTRVEAAAENAETKSLRDKMVPRVRAKLLKQHTNLGFDRPTTLFDGLG